MNKNDFKSELKELMSSMSENEIEKAISALSRCKTRVYKKNNQKNGEKARLYSTTERHESELYYVGLRRKEGTIKVIGASLLTVHDYDLLKDVLPANNDSWWLYDKSVYSDCDKFRVSIRSSGREISRLENNENDNKISGKIRPVLVIDKINGDLSAGDVFYINDEKFQLLTPSIAIKTACFKELCTYNAADYESSVLRYCVDGWYMKLIRDNEQLKQNMSNAT